MILGLLVSAFDNVRCVLPKLSHFSERSKMALLNLHSVLSTKDRNGERGTGLLNSGPSLSRCQSLPAIQRIVEDESYLQLCEIKLSGS